MTSVLPSTESATQLSAEDLRRRASELGWYHHIDLGGGVVTAGLSEHSWRAEHLPPLRGRTVLDIGAWDGGYSFLAERGGASRVVALDHYVWGVDIPARDHYWRQCEEAGVLPDHSRDTKDFWRDDLPGRRPFEFAREVLNSAVEPVVGDFASMDLEPLGTFDVVLFLGVLYHLPEPFSALRRVRSLTREVAVVETVAKRIAGREGEPLLEFLPGNELTGDFGNWFVPTLPALTAMCRAAGFSRVEVIGGLTADSRATPPLALRLLRAALSPKPGEPAQPDTTLRALVHAYI